VPEPLTRPQNRRDFHRFLFADLTRSTPLRREPALEHARRLAELLGDPQDHARQVHVVGTAGKGTAATAVTAVAVAGELTVATHMSPHVYDVRERFLVNGRLVGWDETLEAANEVFGAASVLRDETGRPPTFFAATAALSWVLGRRHGVELQVTEAGIGGRFDASNVIGRDDKITVLTNIGIDHADVLGDDVALIARDKASVVSSAGVVLVGPQTHPEVLEVVDDVAAERGARVVVVDQSIEDWRLAAAAIAGAVAGELGLSRRAGWVPPLPPGRGETWQIDGHRIVVDGAHNPLKLAALFAGLAADGLGSGRGDLTAVVAIGASKDLMACAETMAAGVGRAIVTEFGEPGDPDAHPRSFPAAVVAAALSEQGVEVLGTAPDNALAADLALISLPTGGSLVVTGSFFHLAGVRDRLVDQAAEATQSTPR
jgi:dihydrofolate synthase/folylpolyglutamate synthase